jgi:hypothetical protein
MCAPSMSEYSQRALYRMHGRVCPPLHPVGLSSHRRNGNFDETSIPLRGRPDDKN